MMLRYVEVALSPYEVPGERSICIYIAGCQNSCVGCHFPELQQSDYGDLLGDYIVPIIELYRTQATCVCFLGEGKGDRSAQSELKKYAALAKQFGLKTCLYSGRDVLPESWMSCFDFIKLGSYIEACGPLDVPTTNQRFFKISEGTAQDITHVFWL